MRARGRPTLLRSLFCVCFGHDPGFTSDLPGHRCPCGHVHVECFRCGAFLPVPSAWAEASAFRAP